MNQIIRINIDKETSSTARDAITIVLLLAYKEKKSYDKFSKYEYIFNLLILSLKKQYIFYFYFY